MRIRWLGRIVTCVLLSVFLALVVGAGDARAWWDGKWKYRKKIVLDATPQGADIKDALTDFPVLLRLHTGNFTFENAKNDGSDIRFVAGDDKTLLKHHIERFDPKEQMVLIWVKVPRLGSGSNQDFLWMYYGNGSVADSQDAGGTYDTGQLAVYHLGEKEGNPRDSTAYGNHAKEFTGELGTPAAIGRGVTLKGQSEVMVTAKSPSLNTAKGFTFSAWVRSGRSQENARLFSWDDGKQSVIVGVEGSRLTCTLLDPKSKITLDRGADLPLQKWTHVAVTAEPGKSLTIYVEGKEKANQKLGPSLPAPAADIAIGATLQGKSAFAGSLDEVGIAGVARPAAWIKAMAVGQGPETPLVSYLDEEGSSGGSESLTIHLLVVTAKAITLDGWLIIGLIVVMIGITWALFFNKFMLLRKLKAADAAFAESFSASGELRTLKEKEEDFVDSSLFRVYAAGLGELDRRLASTKCVGSAGLSRQVMNAFRAALDKATIQESKRNTAGLLFFTLSISGGPFMGLFGTVWGVINTFAGVAEAGEANLAAIAPGVASALACTLMGLTLAIPALFQYSYLSGEIKNLTADMNVFVDEFASRVEEEYTGSEVKEA